MPVLVFALAAISALGASSCRKPQAGATVPIPKALEPAITAGFTPGIAAEYQRLVEQVSKAEPGNTLANALVDLASFLYVRLELLPQAREHYEVGLSRFSPLASGRATASYFAARLAAESGDAPAALRHLDSLRTVDRYPPSALLEADLLIQLDEFEAAIETVEDLATDPVYGVPALSISARAQSALGNAREAATLLRTALRNAPDSQAIRYQLALVERDRGRVEEARDLLAGINAATAKALVVPVLDPWLSDIETRFATPSLHLLRVRQLIAAGASQARVRAEFEAGLGKEGSENLRRALVRWLLDQGELSSAHGIAEAGLKNTHTPALMALNIESLVALGRFEDAEAALEALGTVDAAAPELQLLADLLTLRTVGCADSKSDNHSAEGSTLLAWLCTQDATAHDLEAATLWEKAAMTRRLATQASLTSEQRTSLARLRSELRSQLQKSVYYVESLAMAEAALGNIRRAQQWQQLVVEALERVPGKCAAAPSQNRLLRYQAGKNALLHWQTGETLCLLSIGS